MASASASVASTDEAFIPEDLLERLLDSFSEDSDIDDNLVVEGDNGGTATGDAIRLLIEITTKDRLVSYWQVGAYVQLHYTCNYSLYIILQFTNIV